MSKDNFSLVGKTKIYKNGVLVEEKPNTISNDLKEYLANSLNSSVGTYVGSNSLFSNAQSGSTPPASGDGIVLREGFTSPTFYAAETEDISSEATSTYGKRWKGTMIANAGLSVSIAIIGVNWSTVDDDFTTKFATQNFQSVTLAANDTLTIEWEIAIV